MKKPIANVLDEGVNGLQQGKMVETCIALSGGAGEDVAPLLYTAEYLTQAERAEPSEEFRRSARGRLMARLQQTQPLPAPRHDGFAIFETLSRAFSHLSIVGPTVMKSLATFAVMAAVVAVTLGVGAFQTQAPALTESLASQCTLTVLSGAVNIRTPEATAASPGINGMTLDAGTTVSTSEGGSAVLTFFEGSELQLEGSTTVVITEVSEADNGAIAITLTQLAGDTWSHVTKMIDRYSRYEIHTPSAVALVRGTRFLTQVDNNGQTKVETAEGLVSVAGEGEEVYVPVGKKTIVKPGFTPTVPVAMSVPDDEAPMTPRTVDLLGDQPQQGARLGLEVPDEGTTNNGNNGQANANGQSVDKSNNGQANANGQSEDKANNGQANGQSEDKSTNGQANGQSVDKSNNGQANGQSDDKSNNGQANGQSDDKSNNGQANANGQNQDKNVNNGQANANGQSEDKNNNGQDKDNKKDKT